MSKVFNAKMCVLLRHTWRVRDLYVRLCERGRKLTYKVVQMVAGPTLSGLTFTLRPSSKFLKWHTWRIRIIINILSLLHSTHYDTRRVTLFLMARS